MRIDRKIAPLALAAAVTLASVDNPMCQALAENPQLKTLYDTCFMRNQDGLVISAVDQKHPLYESCRPLFLELQDTRRIVANGKVYTWRFGDIAKTAAYPATLRLCGDIPSNA
jgi:hypothetical protein